MRKVRLYRDETETRVVRRCIEVLASDEDANRLEVLGFNGPGGNQGAINDILRQYEEETLGLNELPGTVTNVTGWWIHVDTSKEF